MKAFYSFLVIFAILFNFVSCIQKDITPEDFIKMEDEFLSSERTEKIKAEIAKKYGYSAKQFDDFTMRVETDDKLKEKLGEIRLNLQKDLK